jgi:hypothetical protein
MVTKAEERYNGGKMKRGWFMGTGVHWTGGITFNVL